jgi:hypothetical protein
MIPARRTITRIERIVLVWLLPQKIHSEGKTVFRRKMTMIARVLHDFHDGTVEHLLHQPAISYS